MTMWSTAPLRDSGNTYTPSTHSSFGFVKVCATLTRATTPAMSIDTAVSTAGAGVSSTVPPGGRRNSPPCGPSFAAGAAAGAACAVSERMPLPTMRRAAMTRMEILRTRLLAENSAQCRSGTARRLLPVMRIFLSPVARIRNDLPDGYEESANVGPGFG